MTDTPMPLHAALARLQQYGEHTSTWSTATYNDGTEKALHEIALTLAAEVDRLQARIAELEALKPASIQECQTCGAGYTYGEACSFCEYKKQVAAAMAECPSCAAPADETGYRIPEHRTGCPRGEATS